MSQTPETKKSIEKYGDRCLYCLKIDGVPRNIYTFCGDYGSIMGGGHHLFGRRRVDVAEAIIPLCSEHHYKVTNAKISNCVMIEIMEKVTGVNLRSKYRQFHKCEYTDEVLEQQVRTDN